MLIQELKQLKEGTTVKFKSESSSYNNAICKFKGIVGDSFHLLIVKPGDNNNLFWMNDKKLGLFKITSHSKYIEIYQERNKEQRVLDKIKYLDNKWKNRDKDSKSIQANTTTTFTWVSTDGRVAGSGIINTNLPEGRS